MQNLYPPTPPTKFGVFHKRPAGFARDHFDSSSPNTHRDPFSETIASSYSSFGIGVSRRQALKRLFPQENATLPYVQKVHAYSETAPKEQRKNHRRNSLESQTRRIATRLNLPVASPRLQAEPGDRDRRGHDRDRPSAARKSADRDARDGTSRSSPVHPNSPPCRRSSR
jgi:hypothetical protein